LTNWKLKNNQLDTKIGYGKNNLIMKTFRILFQGDSITDANRGRTDDPNHILGHSYAFSVGSRLSADFPEKHLKFINRGVGGDSHIELEKRWEEDTLKLKPDILSILIGTNSARHACGVATAWDPNKVIDPQQAIETFENVYRSLLRRSRENNPEIDFILGLPFRFPGKGFTAADNAKLKTVVNERGEVVRKLAREFDASVADYPAALEKAIAINSDSFYWCWDGCHVTVAGHEIMAREWMRAAADRLGFLKNYKYR
jgi:lysophospholipase L1-like esterase